MSKTLTHYYKNYYLVHKKSHFKPIVCILLAGLILVFVVVMIAVSNSKTQNYGAKSFYLVYAGKYTITSQATETCTKVSDKGGAGVIYSVGNTKFVVVSIYFSQAEADKVKQQITPTFSESDVLKISAPKLSKSVCNSVEKQTYCKMYYQNLYSFCQDLYQLVIGIDTSTVSTNDVYKQIMKYKQLFVEVGEQLKTSSDAIGKAMYSSNLLVVEQINGFFNSAFVANNAAKHLKKLYANTVFEFVDMCQTINK